MVPKLIFIVGYRDREQQLHFFKRHMQYILEDIDPTEYKILFIHQCDNRSFNRGAMKNIGFITVRDMYPDDYKKITLVFNDIDTMPYTKNFLNYYTRPGYVKHFYGFTFTLGGIVSITGGDFEATNGFPNFWTWGYEDNMLNTRVLKKRLVIDRSHFFPISDKNIIQFHDGYLRNVNRSELDRYAKNTLEGWSSIHNIKYQIVTDDSYKTMSFVNVSTFTTGINENENTTIQHDLRKGEKSLNIGKSNKMGMRFGR